MSERPRTTRDAISNARRPIGAARFATVCFVASSGLLFSAGCKASETTSDSCQGEDCEVEFACEGNSCGGAANSPVDSGSEALTDDDTKEDDVATVPTLIVGRPDAPDASHAPDPSTPSDAGMFPSDNAPDASTEPEPNPSEAPDASVPSGGMDASGPDLPNVGPADAGDAGDAGASRDAAAADSGIPEATAWPCNTGTFSTPELVGDLGVSGEYWAPAWSPNGLELYFAVSGTGITGPNFGEAIYRTSRSNRESAFSPAEAVSELNLTTEQGSPHISANGQALLFFVEGGDTGRDLHGATWDALSGTWTGVSKLPSVNANADDYLPWLSVDDSTLYFTSGRFAGEGGNDLWSSVREGADFSDPVALSAVNSSAPEASPALSPDELTLYFTSERGSSNARYRVYSAARETMNDAFNGPLVVNELSESGDTQQISLSRDGREMAMTSNRDGEQVLWLSRRDCPAPVVSVDTP